MSNVNKFLKRVRVRLQSLSPLIQQKMLPRPEGGKKPKPLPPDQEAVLHAHWTKVGGKNCIAIPWQSLYKAICTAAGDFKMGRKTMTTLVAATITCETDMVSLGTDKFEIFESYVKIPPRTGAMVSIGRPRIREWKAEFIMIVDSEMYEVDMLHKIIEHAGKMVGVGAWRPQLKGPHGRFTVTEFTVL